MELTKELLEQELRSVIDQGNRAAKTAEQAEGAAMMLQHLLRKLSESVQNEDKSTTDSEE